MGAIAAIIIIVAMKATWAARKRMAYEASRSPCVTESEAPSHDRIWTVSILSGIVGGKLEKSHIVDLILGEKCIGVIFRYRSLKAPRQELTPETEGSLKAASIVAGFAVGGISGGIAQSLLQAKGDDKYTEWRAAKKFNAKARATAQIRRTEESGMTLRKRIERNPGSFVIPLESISVVQGNMRFAQGTVIEISAIGTYHFLDPSHSILARIQERIN
jgi:hypothetical protein